MGRPAILAAAFWKGRELGSLSQGKRVGVKVVARLSSPGVTDHYSRGLPRQYLMLGNGALRRGQMGCRLIAL